MNGAGEAMTDTSPESTDAVLSLRRLLDRAMELGSAPRVRLIVLLVAGLVAWLLVLANFPLEVAVPRYADF